MLALSTAEKIIGDLPMSDVDVGGLGGNGTDAKRFASNIVAQLEASFERSAGKEQDNSAIMQEINANSAKIGGMGANTLDGEALAQELYTAIAARTQAVEKTGHSR
jgi:hypothetical protein